jgi:hypothetical protein
MDGRRLRTNSATVVLAIAVGLAGVAPVAGSKGGSAEPPGAGPAAHSAKKKGKKCKKARWKCAPKRLHLSASGIVSFENGSQTWSAEINMRKWRASVGQVQYAQDNGTLTLQASWVDDGPTYYLPECDGTVRSDVPRQTLKLPKGDGFRFNAFLTFYLIGDRKNKYDFIVADNYELAEATGRQTCLSNGSQAAFPYWMIASNNFEVLTPGRPSARRLKGSRAAGGDSIRWEIIRK